AERRGAPQVHQTHGFLARLQVLMRERFPDVLADLLNAGGIKMPTTNDLGPKQPGDEDLEVVIIRRTTLEWVLRKAVVAEPTVEVRTGAVVTGVVADIVSTTPTCEPRCPTPTSSSTPAGSCRGRASSSPMGRWSRSVRCGRWVAC